jgi:hypothetical protein
MRSGALSDSEISNIKHQISNKSQIPISNDRNRFGILNFDYWDLFVIWNFQPGLNFISLVKPAAFQANSYAEPRTQNPEP